MKYSFLPLFIIIFSIISCGKEKFTSNPFGQKGKTDTIKVLDFPGKEFSRYTTVKPKVDFLFLWDNSSSTLLMSPEHRQAMANTINLISEKFDYRMVLSPLIGDEDIHPFWESYIVSEKNDFIPSSPINLKTRWRPPGLGYEAVFTLVNKGSFENGITRAYDLTKVGFEEGIFRREAHMIIVMLSNGDDRSWMIKAPDETEESNYLAGITQLAYLKIYSDKFNSLRINNNSNTFRFLSVVPYTQCTGSKDGATYRAMSERLFQIQKSAGYPATSYSSPPDTLDFCKIESFTNLFSGINATINPVEISYTYNHWPITTDKTWQYDVDSIKVTKRDGEGRAIGDPIPRSDTNGWSPVIGYDTKNIIDCPVHKQITCDMDKAKLMVSGYFIKLNLQGSEKITHPYYLDIFSSAPQKYYGYIKLNYMPYINPSIKLSEAIKVKINNDRLPEGAFEYIGKQIDKNILVKSFTDFSEDTINLPLKQTGYFIKLKRAFGGGTTIQVDYFPAN